MHRLTRDQFQFVAECVLDGMEMPLWDARGCHTEAQGIAFAACGAIAAVCNATYGTTLDFRDVWNQLGMDGAERLFWDFCDAIKLPETPEDFPAPDYGPAVVAIADRYATDG